MNNSARNDTSPSTSTSSSSSRRVQDNSPVSSGLRGKILGYVREAVMMGVLLLIVLKIFGVLDSRKQPELPAGTPAPSISIPLLEGGTFDLHQERGKAVVLVFWATFCPLCGRELPLVDAAVEGPLKELPVQVVAIAQDPVDPQRNEQVRAYIDRRHIRLPIAMDDGSAQYNYRVERIPYTVVIDPDGNIAATRTGLVDEEDLEELVRSALKNGRIPK